MTPANKPLTVHHVWMGGDCQGFNRVRKECYIKDDVLAKVKKLKGLMCLNTKYCNKPYKDGELWVCRNCQKIDSVFGENTQTGIGVQNGESRFSVKKQQGNGQSGKTGGESQTAVSPPKKYVCRSHLDKCQTYVVGLIQELETTGRKPTRNEWALVSLVDVHKTAAKKEMPCKVADTIEASSSKPSPSQNSQCKGCNQDFEGQHRSYCPTQKDRTRKARK